MEGVIQDNDLLDQVPVVDVDVDVDVMVEEMEKKVEDFFEVFVVLDLVVDVFNDISWREKGEREKGRKTSDVVAINK